MADAFAPAYTSFVYALLGSPKRAMYRCASFKEGVAETL
jgi:hypothetical protein